MYQDDSVYLSVRPDINKLNMNHKELIGSRVLTFHFNLIYFIAFLNIFVMKANQEKKVSSTGHGILG